MKQSSPIHSWKPEFALMIADRYLLPMSYWIDRQGIVYQEDDNWTEALYDVQSHQYRTGSMSIARSVPSRLHTDFDESAIPTERFWKHQKWFIPPYEVADWEDKMIGMGGFSSIFRGRWLDTPAVVKRINIENAAVQMTQMAFLREADIWFGLNHINIVKMYGATYTDAPIIVCEYASSGELISYLMHQGHDNRLIWQSLLGAALGLQYLHNAGIAHGDIKGNNVFVGADGIAKLADFGMSRLINDDSKGWGAAFGTYRWKAPEQIPYKDDPGLPPSLPADVYSFAMLMIEIVTGEFPWGTLLPDAVVKFQVKRGKLPKRPTSMDDAEWRLIERMCCFDPFKRVTIDYVVAHLSSLVERLELDQLWLVARGDLSLNSIKNNFVSREGAVLSVMNLKNSKNRRLSSLAADHLIAVHVNRDEMDKYQDFVKFAEMIINGDDDNNAWDVRALANLCWHYQYNQLTVFKLGVVPLLINLACNGTETQKESAIGVLRNLSSNSECRAEIVTANGIPLMCALLRGENVAQKLAAAGVLLNFSADADKRHSLASADCIATCIDLIRNASADLKEVAVGVLRNMSSSDKYKVLLSDADEIPEVTAIIDNDAAQPTRKDDGACIFARSLADRSRRYRTAIKGIKTAYEKFIAAEDIASKLYTDILQMDIFLCATASVDENDIEQFSNFVEQVLLWAENPSTDNPKQLKENLNDLVEEMKTIEVFFNLDSLTRSVAENDKEPDEFDLDEANSEIVNLTCLATTFAIGAPLIRFMVDQLQVMQHDLHGFARLSQRHLQPLVNFRGTLEMVQSYHKHFPDLTPLASRIVLTRMKVMFEAVRGQSEDTKSAILAWRSQWKQECQSILESTAADVRAAISICNKQQRNQFVQMLQFELQKHKDEYSELYRSTVETVLTEDEIDAVYNSPFHDWFIPWYEIDLLELPPRNRIGQSVRGVWEGKAVVVTYISGRSFGDEATFRQNVSKWFALNHPNVVKLVGACHVGIRCIVCEPVDCSLGDLLRQPAIIPWRPLLTQVARGLAYLHDQGIVHEDVRARHIFVKDSVAKLGCLSFRLNKLGGQFADLSLRWMAPELLTNHIASPASDVYSFGMTIIEAATKQPPWRTIGLDMIVRRRVLDKKLPNRPRSSELESAEWELVTHKICAYEPGQRSSMSVVVQNLAELCDANEDDVKIVTPKIEQTTTMLNEWRNPITQKLVADELEELEEKCNRISDSDLDCSWIHKYLQDVWETLHEIDESDLQHGHEAIEQCTRLISNWNKCLGSRLGQHPLERFELPRPFLDQVERLRGELIDLCADFDIACSCLQTIDFKAHALFVVKRLKSSNGLDILPELSTHQLEEILTSLMAIAKYRRSEYGPEYCDALGEYVDQIASRKQIELTAPEWYVRRSDVSSNLVSTVGNQSAFTSVRRSAWHDGSVVAVKFVWKNVSSAFIECVDEWNHFDNHPHVLHLHGACHVGSPQFLVCEFAPEGNFVEYFRNGKNAHVRWQRFLEASKSLRHLHHQGHVHGNIRPTNLLVGGDGKAKLGDIGFAEYKRRCKQVGELDAFHCDLWAAPELSQEVNMSPSATADVYAFGMCILLSYLDEEKQSTHFIGYPFNGTLDDNLRPSEMEDDGWDLVKKMCNRDSNARPNAHTVENSLEDLAKCSAGGGGGDDGSINLVGVPGLRNEDPNEGAVSSLNALDEALKTGPDSMVSSLRDLLRAFHSWIVSPDNQPPISVVRRCQRIADRLITVLNARFDSSIKFFELITNRHLAAVVFDLHTELDYLQEMLDVPVKYCSPSWKAKWDKLRGSQIADLLVACDALCDLSPDKIYEALQYLQFEKTIYRDSYPPEVLEEFDTIINATATRLALSRLLPVWFVPPYEIDFQEGELLGKGGLGEVFRGMWQGMNVAVKTVLSEGETKNAGQCATSNEVFANEASVWFRLNHPHVIKLYSASSIVPSMGSKFQVLRRYFVCELAGKGTLKGFVADGEDQSNAERPREVWEKLYEAALGLQYLHECGIVHGDLKADNILIGSDNRAKLSDFGFSTAACVNTCSSKPMGSFYWMAPECLRKDEPLSLSVASDIYSFGMCILETISQKLPWFNKTGNFPAQIRYFHKKNKPHVRPPRFSNSQWNLVEDMCSYDPDQRISMQDVIQRLAVEAGVQEIHAKGLAVIQPCDRVAVRSAIAKLEEKCSQMEESEPLARLMHGRLEKLCDGLQALGDPLYAQQHQRRFLVVNVVECLISLLRDHMDQVMLMRLATNSTFLEGLTAIRDEIHSLAKMWGLPNTSGDDSEWDKVVQVQKQRLVELTLQSQRYICQRASNARDREALAFVETLVEFPSTQTSPDDQALLENVWIEVKHVRKITKSLGRRWFLPQQMIVPPPTTEQHCSFPHGSFGQLRLNTMKFSGSTFDHHTVAVKWLFAGVMGLADKFLKPLDAWFELSHPNVIELIGAHHLSAPSFVVSEYASNGNFVSYMTTPVGKKRMWQLFLEAALGLQYLHMKKIIHGNLKSTNLLVNTNGKAKLSDFGLSELLDQSKSKSIKQERDKIRWMAPELLVGDPDANSSIPFGASDVFSLGRCLAAALTGAPPLSGQSDDDIITALMDKTPYAKPSKPYIEDEHWEFVQELCEIDPVKRLTIKQAIERTRQFASREE